MWSLQTQECMRHVLLRQDNLWLLVWWCLMRSAVLLMNYITLGLKHRRAEGRTQLRGWCPFFCCGSTWLIGSSVWGSCRSGSCTVRPHACRRLPDACISYSPGMFSPLTFMQSSRSSGVGYIFVAIIWCGITPVFVLV